MRSFALLIPAAAASFVLVACGSSAPEAEGEHKASQEVDSLDMAATAVDAFTKSLAGTYSYVPLQDSVQELTTLTLKKDGSYTADKPGARHQTAHESGKFTASATAMTLTLKPTLASSRKYTLEIADDHTSMALTRSGRTEVFSSEEAPPPPPPPADAGHAGTCASRHGGALITFTIADQSLTLWSTNAAFITESKALLQSGDHRTPNFDKVIDGTDCDTQYSWHVDPANMSYADFTTEVCDGTPSYIESHKATWIKTVGRYCPWGPTVTAVVEQ